MSFRLVLDRKLLRQNPFMTRLKPIQAPPQFTLGFTELEWLGYKAWYREGVARGQLVPDSSENHSQSHESQAETIKKGPTLEG